jgi:hypothetical protein
VSADEQALPPKRRRLSRPGLIVVAIIILAAIVYGLVVALYATSGRVAAGAESSQEPKPGGVLVMITPQSVNATGERINLDVRIIPSEQLIAGDGLTLNEQVNLIITPVDGNQVVIYKKGETPATNPVSVLAPGSVENWPFDQYVVSDLVVLAYTVKDGESEPISTNVELSGYVPGWNIRADGRSHVAPNTSIQSKSGESKNLEAGRLMASRAGSTIAFGFLLLALLVVMPTLVLFVAITAFRGLRKVEASFMSWMGAMLFATIPLRTFLPGSPPIGSWIDFLVVLWVIVALIGGLAIYASAWWKWGTRGAAVKPESTKVEQAKPDPWVPLPDSASSTKTSDV